VFQGSNLNSFANDVLNVQFAGINATSVTADSTGNQVVATFQYGVPFVQSAEVPVLSFNRTSSGTVMYPVNTQTLQHAKQIQQGLNSDCSFAGGCVISVPTTGVSTKLAEKPKDNYISVCG